MVIFNSTYKAENIFKIIIYQVGIYLNFQFKCSITIQNF